MHVRESNGKIEKGAQLGPNARFSILFISSTKSPRSSHSAIASILARSRSWRISSNVFSSLKSNASRYRQLLTFLDDQPDLDAACNRSLRIGNPVSGVIGKVCNVTSLSSACPLPVLD